ncbi:ribonuclease HII, partial [Flavobacteriaceae bacterium]|nr:ribonuclease HII [Flavobacteriaceae bacterium]
SILAKTSRDELMLLLSKKFPSYQWNKNKGYPTKYHRSAISKYGITKHHRKKFKLL